jgi:dihydrofolate reductase
MRQIIAFDHVSVDGYFAGEDGNLDWIVPDEELTQSNLENMAEADTILFGRRTYEMFESFWPEAMKDPRGVEDPHAKGRRSEPIRRVGEWINNATKIVFSRTRSAVTWQGSRLIREFSAKEIEALKQAAGKNMLLLGSGELTRLMARSGLIDEYRFGVVRHSRQRAKAAGRSGRATPAVAGREPEVSYRNGATAIPRCRLRAACFGSTRLLLE